MSNSDSLRKSPELLSKIKRGNRHTHCRHRRCGGRCEEPEMVEIAGEVAIENDVDSTAARLVAELGAVMERDAARIIARTKCRALKAAELVQSFICRAIEKRLLDSYDPFRSSLRTYACGWMSRIACEARRDEQRHALPSLECDPVDANSDSFAVIELVDAIDSLPPAYRAVVRWRAFAERSEIVERMTTTARYCCLHRARNMLWRKLFDRPRPVGRRKKS